MDGLKIVPAAVIGLGPAGVTAAIYLSRMGIQPLAFEGGKIGGHVLKLDRITDYAGFQGSGAQLANVFEQQIQSNGIEVVPEYVISLFRDDQGVFVIRTENNVYGAHAVVIASGLKSREPLSLDSTDVFDNPLLDEDGIVGKNIAILGGGRIAYMGALHLADKALHITIINNKKEAPRAIVEQVENLSNVTFVKGGKENIPSDVARVYDLPGKSRMIGNTSYCLMAEIVDDQDNIAVGKDCQSFVKKVFACGDVVQKGVKSISSAVYDGAIAGVMIYRLLTGMEQVS